MFRTRATVRDIDRGAKRTISMLTDPKSLVVAVGVLGDKANQSAGEGGTATVADIATWHEFGTETLAERSFIRAWFDENAIENKAFARKLAVQRLLGKTTIEKSLTLLGLRAVGGIQKRMSTEGAIQPPLLESTVRRKGSSMPLIDSGQLRASITQRIEQP